MGNQEQSLCFVEQWGSTTAAKHVFCTRTDYLLLSSSMRIRITTLSLIAPIKSPIVIKLKILDIETLKFVHQKTFNLTPNGSKAPYFNYNFKRAPYLKRSGTLLLMCEITGGPTYTFNKSKHSILADNKIQITISRDLPKHIQRLISMPEDSVPAHIFQGMKFVADDQEISWYYCT